tara:strand:- start:1011 stop:1208 length:198 start_codon:yes stop_codon:yes gene_type:complete
MSIYYATTIRKMKKKPSDFDVETKKAALNPQASLDDEIVREVRASINGETLYQYEQRLKNMGVEF